MESDWYRMNNIKILKKSNSPRYVRKEGIKSYLLASPITSGAHQMATTLVEIEPGGNQKIHQHRPEQVYFIIEGFGKMTVGGESRLVEKDDCIFIPSNEPHGLENIGDLRLRYFSAAAPSFSHDELKEFWPIESGSNSDLD